MTNWSNEFDALCRIYRPNAPVEVIAKKRSKDGETSWIPVTSGHLVDMLGTWRQLVAERPRTQIRLMTERDGVPRILLQHPATDDDAVAVNGEAKTA